MFFAAALAVPFAYRWMSKPEGIPPTRQHNGRTEVFLCNPRAWDGEWLPLVEATDRPLLNLVHEGIPHGSVAHINEDGTVLITDNEAGNTRAIRQAGKGVYGWPQGDTAARPVQGSPSVYSARPMPVE